MPDNTPLTIQEYQERYQFSLDNPEQFWAEQAEQCLSWNKPWKTVISGSLDTHDVRWFEGAELNACYNCVDRHLATQADQVAIHWEGNSPNEYSTLTYQELHDQICQLANFLKDRGVKKGERICIYMPMIPEAIVAMLACARIGAVHSVVFAGFSPESLRHRIDDADCSVIITANVSLRGNKVIGLKEQVDIALGNILDVHTVVVVKRNDNQTAWLEDRDFWYHEAIQGFKPECPPQSMKANDPLFILYTSGSTGKPKGILHSTAGYLLYTTITFKTVFNYQQGDIHWCSADIGWITGHSYIVYGPLSNGASIVLFEGIPTYPSADRYWQIIDKVKVNSFYTAPTAIRSLMREGDEPLKSTSRESLKILGTVGEPINPNVWQWYYDVVGKQRCPVVDTWWQTETAGIIISPLPGTTPLKPGSVGWPFFGIKPEIVDDAGNIIEDDREGNLVISAPWPGIMLTVHGNQQRFIDGYFKTFAGKYLTGDSARRDAEGNYWITGRIDDVINVAGHRICTAEIESAIVKHPDIAEAAVIGAPHDIKGQCIYAFVTAKKDVELDKKLKSELKQLVRSTIGPFAVPAEITWTNELPKTRSGKIMRRLLRKIVSGQIQELGDMSTLSNPEIVNDIIASVKEETSSQAN